VSGLLLCSLYVLFEGSCKHHFAFLEDRGLDGAGTRLTGIQNRGMLAVLQLLTLIESWHLVAAGGAGAVLCMIFGRTTPFGLIGAALCGVVALAGATDIWRSFGAPRQVAVVMARTVGAQGGDDDVEWKFENPHTIFLHSRRPGDALWIDGIRIFAKNLSDRPLTNLRAAVRSHRAGTEMKMNLVLDNRQLDGSEPQIVPGRSDFSLLYLIPSRLDDRAFGIPAAQFAPTFGDLSFMFRYDTNQMFARLVSVPEIERQLSQIER
jgi:hypothetical protein